MGWGSVNAWSVWLTFRHKAESLPNNPTWQWRTNVVCISIVYRYLYIGKFMQCSTSSWQGFWWITAEYCKNIIIIYNRMAAEQDSPQVWIGCWSFGATFTLRYIEVPFDGGCNTPAIVDRMGGPRCLSGYTSLVDIDNIDERVRNCFGNYVFAFFVNFLFFDLLFCPFSCHLQHFGEGSCQFNGIATFWSSNFEPLIFYCICIILCSNFSCWMVFRQIFRLGSSMFQ